jgi:hypothetical protein
VTFHPTSPTSLQPVSGQYFAPSGLTGATAASRYVGATAAGAPGSGTFAIGDYVIDQSGAIWVCTVAGSPGTWVKLGQLDATASDIQPVGTALAAGSVGKAADAGHVHTGLALQATTPVAGYTLINGTGTIISYTSPNDGAIHPVAVFGGVRVTSTETGGAIQLSYTYPDGSATTDSLNAGGAGAGHNLFTARLALIEANTAFQINQSSALSSGAAVAWAQIWAG